MPTEHVGCICSSICPRLHEGRRASEWSIGLISKQPALKGQQWETWRLCAERCYLDLGSLSESELQEDAWHLALDLRTEPINGNVTLFLQSRRTLVLLKLLKQSLIKRGKRRIRDLKGVELGQVLHKYTDSNASALSSSRTKPNNAKQACEFFTKRFASSNALSHLPPVAIKRFKSWAPPSMAKLFTYVLTKVLRPDPVTAFVATSEPRLHPAVASERPIDPRCTWTCCASPRAHPHWSTRHQEPASR